MTGRGLDIFGATFACECGRTHHVQPGRIVYADGAIAALPGLCAEVCRERSCAVVMDARTRLAAGAEAGSAMARAGWRVREVIVPDPPGGGSPVCDDLTKDALAPLLAGARLVLAVGSGVVNDLAKWLAFQADLPFVTFATAASMNGYTSANVAPTVGGVKMLVRARPPAAVASSPAVLAHAPYEMTAAGLGDVLAKSTSSADWLLNARLFGDYYCPRSVGLIAEIEPLYLEHPGDLKARRPGAMEALLDALLLTGGAMTMADTSAPASGGEHLISHTLDMMSSIDGRGHDLHGRQVGVATVLAAEVYRRALAVESPAPRRPPGEIDRVFWGPLAAEVAARYAEKAARLEAARAALSAGQTWDELRAALAPLLRSPEQIHGCLAAAGAANRAEDIAADRARLLSAFLHAHQMRPRYTVLDLAHVLGILPAAAGEIVETWA